MKKTEKNRKNGLTKAEEGVNYSPIAPGEVGEISEAGCDGAEKNPKKVGFLI